MRIARMTALHMSDRPNHEQESSALSRRSRLPRTPGSAADKSSDHHKANGDRIAVDGHPRESRELWQDNIISQGQLPGIFYSLDFGAKNSDLLDSVVRLEPDQKIFDRVEVNRNGVREDFYYGPSADSMGAQQ